MKKFFSTLMMFIVIMLLVSILTACNTVYRDRYTALEYDPTLLKSYDITPPPTNSVTYSTLEPDAKESLWIDYTLTLLEVNGKHNADKAGLRKADDEFKKKVEELNKKAVAK